MRNAWIETFECDLTDEQRQLCEWIAQQAQAGVKRITYKEALAVLDIGSEKELTCTLRTLRERLDQIQTMIQSPIVHTNAPYFDVHPDGGQIWERYLQAEEQVMYFESEAFGLQATPVSC